LLKAARPGQIVIELGSYPVPVKERQIAPLAEKGAFFIDGEVAGTPGMVLARKGVVFLAGDANACLRIEPVVAGFADSCIYFGPFGAASRVKLINNLLVSIHIAATAEAMALGLKSGIGVNLMIKSHRRRRRRLDPNKIAHATYDTPDLDRQTEYYTDILCLGSPSERAGY
jgi:3-hydroxyisobutyrate dehydrogenase-like beta-hydroxyacid dehydrogenase